MKSACFRRLTPLNSFAGARCDATCYPRGQCFSTGLSCTVRESERCRASARAMRRWETSSGAPETGLEHCAQVSRGCRARGAPGLKGPWVDGWVVTWAMGPCGMAHTRAMRGAHAGDAWRTRGRCVAWGRVRVGPPAGAHRVGGQALCGSGAWRAPLLTRAFSFHRPLREQGRAWTVEEGRQNTRGAWMAAAEKARGAEAKGAEATAAERASGRR